MQQLIEKAASFLLLALVVSYRTIGTLFFGGACRFEPSCSEYALESIRAFPPKIAAKLVMKRILKCRPGGSSGFDPVPVCEHPKR